MSVAAQGGQGVGSPWSWESNWVSARVVKCYYLLSRFSRPVFYIFSHSFNWVFIIFAYQLCSCKLHFKVSNSTSIIFYFQYLIYI